MNTPPLTLLCARPWRPDGRRECGFDFFDYTWKKGDVSLRAEFEKSGRGLTALETPDYEISTEVDDHDLVFGSSYKVRYRIKNTSASELAVEIKAHYTRVSYRGTIAP
ncbi:hypothetical protein J7E78_11330 [Paenibacillus polymyxa]|uniref:hypothetical protein n=1 Tax=Paenibacillus polymyxa TaxID=1406 RepID=UPI001BE5E5DD|nr:hypothetical protein [Paenibacillus polymyxa]MBT2284129.1 hypothetical protein [Paenibacillus polymyxa]